MPSKNSSRFLAKKTQGHGGNYRCQEKNQYFLTKISKNLPKALEVFNNFNNLLGRRYPLPAGNQHLYLLVTSISGNHCISCWLPSLQLRMIRASLVFFNIRGENFSFFKKMLNSSSFMLLLCVSGDFKKKNFFSKIFLTDRKISSNHVVFTILKLFTTYNF